jgi:hypothetical protein
MEFLKIALGIWLLMGCGAVVITALGMGFLRWRDLFLIPFGILYVVSPWWKREDGRILWGKDEARD